MRTTLFIFLHCFFFLSSAYAQLEVDTVDIKGYLVYSYSEKMIKDLARNTKARLGGARKFYSPIDIRSREKFYPIQDREKLKTVLERPDSGNHLFFPFEEYYYDVRESYRDRLGIKHMETLRCEQYSSPYIKVKGQKNKLFKAYSLTGRWLRIKVDTAIEEELRFLIRYYHQAVPDRIYYIYIFIQKGYFTEYINSRVDPSVKITGLIH